MNSPRHIDIMDVLDPQKSNEIIEARRSSLEKESSSKASSKVMMGPKEDSLMDDSPPKIKTLDANSNGVSPFSVLIA